MTPSGRTNASRFLRRGSYWSSVAIDARSIDIFISAPFPWPQALPPIALQVATLAAEYQAFYPGAELARETQMVSAAAECARVVPTVNPLRGNRLSKCLESSLLIRLSSFRPWEASEAICHVQGSFYRITPRSHRPCSRYRRLILPRHVPRRLLLSSPVRRDTDRNSAPRSSEPQ